MSDRMPLVAVVMGSSSDLSVMDGAREVLEEFGVPVERRVVSAHRSPGPALIAVSTSSTLASPETTA